MENDSLFTELLKKLVDTSEQTSRNVEKLDKKLDLHIQASAYEFEKIKSLDDTQNRILEEHVAGVNTLKNMYSLLKKEHESRLEKLEEPRKWLKTTKNILLWLAAAAGAVMSIMQAFQYFKS